jgi:hypothetical protein
MHITLIEKKVLDDTTDKEPRYELDRYGEDVAEHNGIKWVYLLCPHCGTRTKFIPIHSAVVKRDDEYGLMETEKDYHYICKCDYCDDVVYIKFWEVDFDPDWHFGYEFHYPVSKFDYNYHELPDTILLALSEAHTCLNARAYLACVVMCRRTIEAILKDRGASAKSNLAESIKSLTNNHSIHESMMHLADLVRVVGNIGAHASDLKVEDTQARETYELTKKLVDMLYVIPKHAEATKEKMARQKEELKVASSKKADAIKIVDDVPPF